MHDPVENKKVCSECGKNFTWTEGGDTGGRDKELINCPYCNATNGSIRTSGFVFSSKVD